MFFRQKWKRILGISMTGICLFATYYFFLLDDINLEYSADFDYDCPSNKSSANKHICFEEPPVFFVETSGSTTLNIRQACAIESTARHNPSMKMNVLMTPSSPITHDHDLITKLISLENVALFRISIDVLLHDSPMFKWYRRGKWKKSKWKISHMSDALRFLLIWKYGGIYLDMDIVTLRSLEHLKNSAVTENWDRVAAGILIFDKHHELLRRCMVDFANEYDPYNFVRNGPGIFTENIRKYCDIHSIGKVSGAGCGINILPPEAAFPISYDRWKDYFVENSVKNISTFFNSSYLIHVWNKFSNEFKLKLGSNSLYELAIKQHCPLVYEYAQTVGYI